MKFRFIIIISLITFVQARNQRSPDPRKRSSNVVSPKFRTIDQLLTTDVVRRKKGGAQSNIDNNIDTNIDTNTNNNNLPRFQSLAAKSKHRMWSHSQSKKGGKSGGNPLAAVANAAKKAVAKVKSVAKAVVAKAKAVVAKVKSAVKTVSSKAGKSGKSGKGGKPAPAPPAAPPAPPTPPFNCALGGQPVGSGSAKQTTFSDKQACVACKFVWSNVNAAKSAGTTPDLVGQQFDEICADAPDVFYQGCDDMYDQIGSLIKDSMSGASVDQICGCAKMCAPDTLVKGGSGGGLLGSVSGLLRL